MKFDIGRELEEARVRNLKVTKPTVVDYSWYALGKFYVFLIGLWINIKERMARATSKIHTHRAFLRDFDKREQMIRESYHTGGCSK